MDNFTHRDIDYSKILLKVSQKKVVGSVSGTSINYETVLLGKIDQISDWVKLVTDLKDKIDNINIKPYFVNGQFDINQINSSTAQTSILTAITACTFINGRINVLQHNNSMIRLCKNKFESNWNEIRLIQGSGGDFGNTINTGSPAFTIFSNFVSNIHTYYNNILNYNTYNQTNNYLISAITETRKQIENNLISIPLL